MDPLTLAPMILAHAGPDTTVSRALACGDELLAANDLVGALRLYLTALVRGDDESSDLHAQPSTLELVELQARIGTVLFSLGAQEQGRLCLARAATLAEGTAWSPSVDEVPRERDPLIAPEYANWSRIAECGGLDPAELERLADLLRRWGRAWADRGREGDGRRAVAFWELGARLLERSFPDAGHMAAR